MKMSIRVKLVAAFLGVAVLVLIAGGVGLFMANVLGGAGDKVAKEMSPLQYAALRCAQTAGRVQELVLKYSEAKIDLSVLEKQISEKMHEFEMWYSLPLLGSDSAEFKADFGAQDNRVTLAKATGPVHALLTDIKSVDDNELESAFDSLIKAKKTLSQFVVTTESEPIFLNIFAKNAYLDYLNWVSSVQDAVNIGTTFKGEVEPKKTYLGKWLYTTTIDDPEIKSEVAAIIKQYEKLFGVVAGLNALATFEEKEQAFSRTSATRAKLADKFRSLSSISQNKMDKLDADQRAAVILIDKGFLSLT